MALIRRDRYANIDVTNALRKLDSLRQSVPEELEDLQIEAANLGAEKMREYISTRGVYTMNGRIWTKTYQGRDRSAPGRVNTGYMLSSVRVGLRRGANRVIASFGWISDFQEYFRAQEYGFEAGGYRAPIPVPGMFALRDARRFVQNALPRLIQKYEKRIAKRTR